MPMPIKGTSVEKEPEPKFTPFTGGGKRLDGRSTKQQAIPASTLVKDAQVGLDKKQQYAATGSAPSSGPIRQKTGKLVFGSSANSSSLRGTNKVSGKELEQDPTKKEETKFQAFTGKKYSLKG